MASAWPEEMFVCSVCLETLKDPATLTCGHSYCLACIHRHWDRGSTRGQYSCPQCRQTFSPRPSLARSTMLMEAIEKLSTQKENQESPYLTLSSAPPSMPIYLEVLPNTGPGSGPRPARHGSVYPQLPTVAPRPCPQHQRPMELYCHDDKECVCDECCHRGHQGHWVVRPEEARQERQQELAQMQAETQRRMQETEMELKELPQRARLHKTSFQALQKEGVDVFAELQQSVGQVGTQVCDLLSAHESTLGSRAEGQIHSLEQEVAQLRWKEQELARLAGMEDHICFLKNFLTLEPLGPEGPRAGSVLGGEAVVEGVRSALTELREALQDLCKKSLAKIFRAVNDVSVGVLANGEAAATGNGSYVDNTVTASPNTGTSTEPASKINTVYEMTTDPPPLPPPRPQSTSVARAAPSFSTSPDPLQPQAPSVSTVGLVNLEPKTREDMLKFRFDPTFDPNTANRHLRLSDSDRKVTLRGERQNHADHPDRFLFWRQILGREALAGSPYYWEVEWTGQKVTVGVTYREIDRKNSDDSSRLGHNLQSWALYWSGSGFALWHAGTETMLGTPRARRVGVYLDQQEGLLAFYRVNNNQAHLIHALQTQFTGALYPGFRFWSGVGSTITLCQLE
ncbi:finTRIM family, member 86 [Hypomesus transpacificus]|uniref:finTRIM family, member 86 n=1 Tax=Hypomesus transpacificus TaxID=137520 RepID=UPI001F07518C|nr:finTRIM family, member 86 [Hypomesus transpacificus]